MSDSSRIGIGPLHEFARAGPWEVDEALRWHRPNRGQGLGAHDFRVYAVLEDCARGFFMWSERL